MKYTKEVLADAASRCTSIRGVLRELGISPNSGGMSAHVKKRIKLFEIDTSHFYRQGWNKGKPSLERLTWQRVLVVDRRGNIKEDSQVLRRAMIESGIEYRCEDCGCPPVWNGKPLTLEADHKNGNNTDNRKENLRFLCLNCHSQTDNFRSKNRNKNVPMMESVDNSDLKPEVANAT